MKIRAMLVVLGLLGLVEAGRSAPPTRFEYEQPHMGTKFRIVLFADNQSSADRSAAEAFARIEALNRIMSDYDSASELMQLCRRFADTIGPPVRVSPELFHVLRRSTDLSIRSDSLFDVSIGPLVQLWRLSRRTGKLPTDEQLSSARARVGHRFIELDPVRQTVRLVKPGMQLDLGGIAKGYAADEALAVLKSRGLSRALVAAGGDIAVGDAPPGKPGWDVTVTPLTRKEPSHHLQLVNAAVSTSGDARQAVTIDGRRYSHIVDPRTGLGMTRRCSVTVVAPYGIQSDSLTKAVLMLPPDRVEKLIDAVPGAAALIVTDDDAGETERATRRWIRMVAE